MPAFSVSDRISVLGCLGTVRYVGVLPAWGPGVVAYGVEWDDKARGKHSGELAGVRYFCTRVPNAGSFIKASNKNIDAPCLFLDAVRRRYSSEANSMALVETVKIGSKTVEKYGFGRLSEVQADVAALGVVMVDHQQIRAVGGKSSPEPAPGSPLFSAHTLDLGSNLLVDWAEVAQIVRHFPRLQAVNLNGNRLRRLPAPMPGPASWTVFPASVREVALSATYVLAGALLCLDLSHVTRLELAANGIDDQWLAEWRPPPRLQAVDLSFNSLRLVPPALHLQTLAHVVLADNCISDVAALPVFPHTRTLDLRRNPISSYEDVDALAGKFPALRELRINGCPVFDGLSPEEEAFALIGRLECQAWARQPHRAVCKLNGSPLQALEIRNGELHFMAEVRAGRLACSNTRRWQALLTKYHVSAEPGRPGRPGGFSVDRRVRLSVRLAASPDTELFSRVFAQNSPVLRLKGLVARHVRRYVLDVSLFYYVHDDAALGPREPMADDAASLQSHGFSDNHRIYVL
ncbi:RNI-like protein [Metschnikowia bicuspidata var. bicuspidata NRRL YB-4993]|uniref:RNI-like protein n=1 Tax=Metschnikowia bicuspidata var. bicuspidata NRRL YB-4993 TaxID=869754 RepID=A0A1A0HDK0_9ASCO|nr:RNI-like protein [Metschnikowia bicuspidata var. bicuspidata NRRL YB-4993]OBA22003.1 RNI-like protein [Metschnikowia bicuspidata var. bicuspidata NRRL YB-4993]